MANIKITDLTAYTDPNSTDVLPIVDVGADVTKKISIADLLENAGSGTESAPGIAFDGDNTGIYRPGPGQLAISTNGAERVEFGTSEVVFNDGGADYDFRIEGGTEANLFFVDASTNRVGLGTGSPAVKLDTVIDSAVEWTSGANLSSTENLPFIGLSINNVDTSITGTESSLLIRAGGSGAAMHSLTVKRTGNNTGDLIFRRRVSTASAESMRIDNSGRLLVGTSSAPTGTSTQYTKIGAFGNSLNNTVSFLSLSYGSPATSLSAGIGIGRIFFGDTAAAEFASISAETDGSTNSGDYPGRLVFSTTADGESSPTERMRINRNGASTWFAEAGDSVFFDNAATAGTSYRFIGGRYGATGVGAGIISFNVFTNGNVTNTNNSYGAISDATLKENIVDAKSQWDDLKAIQVRNYNFKKGQTHTQIGVVAQEIELVSPGLVTNSPDVDKESNDLGTVTKSVNYSVLYMKAVKALQEAMERIEVLEAKVNALEGN